MSQESFTKRQIKRAFQKFSDLASDVGRSDWKTWPENLRQLLHFCETDPVLQEVLAPLKNTALADYNAWQDRVAHRRDFSAGIFPTDENEQTALYYQILLAANSSRDTHDFTMNLMFRIFDARDLGHLSDFVQLFNDEIFIKFARTTVYRLVEIEEDIQDQAEVSREALIAFHITNYGTFVSGNIQAEHQSQIAVGGSQIASGEV